jgi:hypothetical protein
MIATGVCVDLARARGKADRITSHADYATGIATSTYAVNQIAER